MLRFCRMLLMVICIVNGVSALICGPLMFLAPDGSLMGMQALIGEMQAFPLADVFFQDLFWSGIALLMVNGIPNLITTVLLFKKHPFAYRAGIICGVLLVLWSVFECIYIPNPLSIGYLVVGIIQTSAAVYLVSQERKGRPGSHEMRNPSISQRSKDRS